MASIYFNTLRYLKLPLKATTWWLSWPVALLLLLLVGLPAQAMNYTFSATGNQLPAGCSLNTSSTSSYTCGVLSLPAGDTITIGSIKPVIITFTGAFTTGAGVLVNAGGATADLSLVVDGAVSLGAGSALIADLQTLNAGAVTIGADSWISGNVSTETGYIVIGASTIPPPLLPTPQQTGVGGKVSTMTGYVSIGADSLVNGSVTTNRAGYVVLGARAKTAGSITTVGAGYVVLEASAQVNGSITVRGTTAADYVTTGAGSLVSGNISTVGSYISLGASAQVNGNISTKISYITVGANSSVDGQIAMNDPTPSYISIGAGSRVYAVCCNGTDASCVTDGSGITPGPLVCVRSSAGTSVASFECIEAGINSPWTAAARKPLYTKVAGIPFYFDVVALNASGTIEPQFVQTGDAYKMVTVELVNGSGITACASRTPISPAVSHTLRFDKMDAGRRTSAPMRVTNAYVNLRCRVTDTNQSPSLVGCSSDAFSVRPAAFLVSQNTPNLNAGTTFTVQASAIQSDLNSLTTAYAGTPTLNVGQFTGVTAFTSSALAPQVLPAANGGVSGGVFTYDDVGSFTLPANAPSTYGVSDSTFTAVDMVSLTVSDCVAGSASNTADASGKFGCVIGQSAALTVGRFYPDHFDFMPVFAPGCIASSFTYMDQPFSVGYTVTAKSLARGSPNPPGNTALKLYSGGKLNIAALNGTTDLVGRLLPAVANPLSPTWTNGVATVAASSYTFTQPTTTVPDATWGPYEVLNIGVAVDDADGRGYGSVTNFTATTPATCTLGSASECKKYASLTAGTSRMLYGRAQLKNAYGAEYLALPLPMALQFWNSTWVTNPLDICTNIVSSHFAWDFLPAGVAGRPNNLAACNSALSVSGIAPNYTVNLSAPGAGRSGWSGVSLNLGAVATGNQCVSVGGAGNAASTANAPWLRFSWAGASRVNPAARATFGVYRSPLIYRRENY